MAAEYLSISSTCQDIDSYKSVHDIGVPVKFNSKSTLKAFEDQNITVDFIANLWRQIDESRRFQRALPSLS